MNIYYSKSSPKINDYNPLTGNSFYSQPISPPRSVYDSSIFRDANKIYSNIGPVPPAAIYSPSKPHKEFKDPITGRTYSFSKPSNVFTNTANLKIGSSGPSLFRNSSQPSLSSNHASTKEPRFYKNKPRTELRDPLTGNIRKYDSNFNVEPFDTFITRDRLRGSPVSNSLRDFYDKKSAFQAQESIASAMRKEVADISYVNPYMLKAATQSDPTQHPAFKRAAETFFR